MKDFNLSDKRLEENYEYYYRESDVREFVLRIKGILNEYCYCNIIDENNQGLGFVKYCDACMIIHYIKRFAGDKLIGDVGK